MSETELKNCPFCGTWAAMLEIEANVWAFNCYGILHKQQECPEISFIGSHEDAVKAFNLRTSDIAETDAERGISITRGDFRGDEFRCHDCARLETENAELKSALADYGIEILSGGRHQFVPAKLLRYAKLDRDARYLEMEAELARLRKALKDVRLFGLKNHYVEMHANGKWYVHDETGDFSGKFDSPFDALESITKQTPHADAPDGE